MNARSDTRLRPLVAVAVVASLLLLLAAGCTRNQRAEQDGKESGEALCELRDADDAEDASEALADLQEQLSDLSRKYSTFTAEDRADIEENLSDLVEHVAQGNDELAQQDLAVIKRSIDNIEGDVSDTGQAALEGFLQGIDDCVG
jgi:hypothetical protein